MKLGEVTLPIRPKLLPFPSPVAFTVRVAVSNSVELEEVLNVFQAHNLIIEGARLMDVSISHDPFAPDAPAASQAEQEVAPEPVAAEHDLPGEDDEPDSAPAPSEPDPAPKGEPDLAM